MPLPSPRIAHVHRPSHPVTLARIFGLWWPLAASWLLMGIELPVFTAVVARMPDATPNLAGFGALVYPFCLLIEAPIIMLLAASTALCRDWDSYQKLQRFTTVSGASLTAIHVLIAFTPLFDVVATHLVDAPAETLEPGRIGLQIMTPWTWAIAQRRFQQGVLIRFHDPHAVVIGTFVRLLVNGVVLTLGYLHGGWSGIAVGSAAISAGVTAEALFVAWRVQPILRVLRAQAPDPAQPPLVRRAFLAFYLPLAATPLMTLLIQPIGASAMSRMPAELTSLAAWTPVYSLVFLTRTTGFAYNEVVVTLVDQPGGGPALRRFALILAAAMMAVLALIAFTPLAGWWFGSVQALEGEVLALAVSAVALGALMPGYAVLQNWYQGVLVHHRRTTAVTEAVALYLVTSCLLLGVGVLFLELPGIYVALCSFTAAGLLQTAWLERRSRSLR